MGGWKLLIFWVIYSKRFISVNYKMLILTHGQARHGLSRGFELASYKEISQWTVTFHSDLSSIPQSKWLNTLCTHNFFLGVFTSSEWCVWTGKVTHTQQEQGIIMPLRESSGEIIWCRLQALTSWTLGLWTCNKKRKFRLWKPQSFYMCMYVCMYMYVNVYIIYLIYTYILLYII